MDNLSLWKELRKRMSVGRAGGQSPAAGLPSPGARAAEQGTQRCRILPPERAQARLMGDGRRISAPSSALRPAAPAPAHRIWRLPCLLHLQRGRWRQETEALCNLMPGRQEHKEGQREPGNCRGQTPLPAPGLEGAAGRRSRVTVSVGAGRRGAMEEVHQSPQALLHWGLGPGLSLPASVPCSESLEAKQTSNSNPAPD